jgi:hypothetical protein
VLTCRELVELVTDYLEGALAARRQQEVHEHLLGCADCLRYVGQIQLTSRLLSELPSAELTEEDYAPLTAAFLASPIASGAAEGGTDEKGRI